MEQLQRLPQRDSRSLWCSPPDTHVWGGAHFWAGISHGKPRLASGGKHYSWLTAAPRAGGGWGPGGTATIQALQGPLPPHPPPPWPLETAPPSPRVSTQETWAWLPFPGSVGGVAAQGLAAALAPGKASNHLIFELAGPLHPVGQESFLTFIFPASQIAFGLEGPACSSLQPRGLRTAL